MLILDLSFYTLSATVDHSSSGNLHPRSSASSSIFLFIISSLRSLHIRISLLSVYFCVALRGSIPFYSVRRCVIRTLHVNGTLFALLLVITHFVAILPRQVVYSSDYCGCRGSDSRCIAIAYCTLRFPSFSPRLFESSNLVYRTLASSVALLLCRSYSMAV